MTSPAPGPTSPKLTAANIQQLCLTCASSLPPRAQASAIFRTKCCARPICPACLERKPRLAQYNPCLLCQSGVGASASGLNGSIRNGSVNELLKDADAYIIGTAGDDSEDESPGPPAYTDGPATSEAPSSTSSLPSSPSPPPSSDTTLASDTSQPASAGPRTYYLKPNDTLSSLALRFRVPARVLCTFNRLPPAVLSTQPHLLHTRSSISIPAPSGASASGLNTLVFDADAEEQESEETRKERERKRARERAAVKLATLTKQDDPDIVRAYVALAEGEAGEGGEAEYERIRKAKEAGRSAKDVVGLEGAVVDRYLEDDEWEADMRRRGLGPSIKARQSAGKAQ